MMIRFTLCALALLSAGLVYAKESTTRHGIEPKDVVKAKSQLLPIEKNVIQFTNWQRKRHGLAPLEVDIELVKSAREHASWMTRNRTLQHTGRPVAENIAMGYSSSESVVNGWMNSSGHRANILSAGHRRIGVAAYRTKNGTIYWCQQFRR
ncbi:MAG TPA: CAP domain-containing protein [Thermoguttaceae bacterium]|nr:CAP domain-containing protein [Thermoguttaceae bacterium]